MLLSSRLIFFSYWTTPTEWLKVILKSVCLNLTTLSVLSHLLFLWSPCSVTNPTICPTSQFRGLEVQSRFLPPFYPIQLRITCYTSLHSLPPSSSLHWSSPSHPQSYSDNLLSMSLHLYWSVFHISTVNFPKGKKFPISPPLQDKTETCALLLSLSLPLRTPSTFSPT